MRGGGMRLVIAQVARSGEQPLKSLR
jgi:hypothetical protein